MASTELRAAAQQALEVLELVTDLTNHDDEIYDAIDALKAALEEPVQEPVAWRPALKSVDPIYRSRTWNDGTPRAEDVDYWTRNGQGIEYAYTAPPQRLPLTEEEIQAAWDSVDMRHPRGNETRIAFARAVERAHKIGGEE